MVSTKRASFYAQADPAAPSRGVILAGGRAFACAFGRKGLVAAAEKREGDLATPIGTWALRRVLYRADRMDRPAGALPTRALSPDDGWCDDPADPAYNRPVRLPYPARHEVMTRADALYDLVVVLGHNDDPPQPDRGSAIFLHCAKRADGARATAADPAAALNPTAGCIAVARETLASLLADAAPGALVEVARHARAGGPA